MSTSPNTDPTLWGIKHSFQESPNFWFTGKTQLGTEGFFSFGDDVGFDSIP